MSRNYQPEDKPRCDGKVIYPTWTRATHGAENLNRSQEDAHAHAYACNRCGKYHVGGNHMKAPAKKEQRNR